MLFSFNLIIFVCPIDFGPTDELKRQCYSIFLSFQWLDPITRLFSLVSTSPGTARQYQNARAVPHLGWLPAARRDISSTKSSMGASLTTGNP